MFGACGLDWCPLAVFALGWQLGGTTSAPRAHPSSVIARRVDDLCVGHSYCEAKLWPDTNLGHTCAAAIYIAARTPIERWALMFI